uniref:GUN5 n=1 Tax=Arundo donax TaxID=35708 RepID=A0A0A9D4Q3_ARUDO
MELNTFRYAAVPTLPLSGGKLKTVIASFFSSLVFLLSFAHLIALVQSCSTLLCNACDFPVLGSRPAKTMGSIPPSSSGSATCSATWIGCNPKVLLSHSSVVWNTSGSATMYGTSSFCSTAIALGWSCLAGPPTSANPVSDTTALTKGLPVTESTRYRCVGPEKSSPPAKIGMTLAPLASSSMMTAT